MGKVTSLYGKTTGKIGSIVFATSGGETIAREYNPHVANPSTMPQVNQRARMKLMSQISATLAPVIAMTKEGLKSKRNKFVSKNFENSYALNGTAQISYENLQLTEGSIGLPQVILAAGSQDESPYAYLATEPAQNIARVVYCVFEKTQENRLALVKSVIATERSVAGHTSYYFYADMAGLSVAYPDVAGEFNKEYVIYAYGMIDTTERASARYGNLNVHSASDLATLVANRSISFEDYQFTQTRGATVGNGQSGDTPVPAGHARVFVTAVGNGGAVTGGGTFAIGSQVTVEATPAAGYVFSGWVNNGTNQIVSASATYTFTLVGQTDLVATFYYQGNDTL